MERIVEQNLNGLITKIITDGDVPTTADIYAKNCNLFTIQTISATTYINGYINLNSSGVPN